MATRPGRGASLMETVLASFLLATILLVVVALFHRSLQLSNLIERQARAQLLARETLTALQAELDSDLSVWFTQVMPGAGLLRRSRVDGFDVRVRAMRQVIYSPCTTFGQLDSGHTTGYRQLHSSYARAQVDVRWPGSATHAQLVTLLPQPPVEVEALEVTPQDDDRAPLPRPVPLPLDGKAFFRGTIRTRSGYPLWDCLFRWYCRPGSGNATMIPSRSGVTGLIIHRVRLIDGDLSYSRGTGPGHHNPSTCRAAVRCTYRGRERVGVSPVIFLAVPP